MGRNAHYRRFALRTDPRSRVDGAHAPAAAPTVGRALADTLMVVHAPADSRMAGYSNPFLKTRSGLNSVTRFAAGWPTTSVVRVAS